MRRVIVCELGVRKLDRLDGETSGLSAGMSVT